MKCRAHGIYLDQTGYTQVLFPTPHSPSAAERSYPTRCAAVTRSCDGDTACCSICMQVSVCSRLTVVSVVFDDDPACKKVLLSSAVSKIRI